MVPTGIDARVGECPDTVHGFCHLIIIGEPVGASSLDLVLPPMYSRRILYSCLQGLLVTLYAASAGLWRCAAIDAVVTVCSVNYWRDPRRTSVRRTADMSVALFAVIWHAALAWNQLHKQLAARVPTQLLSIYTIGLLTSILAYGQARRSVCHSRSSWIHCIVHLCTSVSLISLYKNAINNK